MPQAATAEHRGDGVDRRNAHHERSARERSEREAGMRAFEPPPDEEGAVEHVSASVVLAAVEESGPNYLLPKAPEPVKSRRKRLRVDEAARHDGLPIVRVKDWSAVTPSFLGEEWERIQRGVKAGRLGWAKAYFPFWFGTFTAHLSPVNTWPGEKSGPQARVSRV